MKKYFKTPLLCVFTSNATVISLTPPAFSIPFFIKKYFFVFSFLLFCSFALAQNRKTVVSIRGEDFYINGQITMKGRQWQGQRLEGLLPNARMVQGTFDDNNPETSVLWKYSDTGKWDAERNTNEFVKAMSSWKKHGLLAVTLNLQGGSPQGYSKDQPWHNSAFKSDGSLDDNYMKRLDRILKEADNLGMVVILGYFYFGQDQRLENEASVIQAVKNATQWIVDKGYENVMIEINNECDINDIPEYKGDPYNHAILGSKRVHELILVAKSITKNGKRLLVSTSFKGGALPTDNVLEVNDMVLVHGNSVKKPERIKEMVQIIRQNPKYKGQPIVFNEDDHFDFDKPMNNFIAATSQHASWGYFDFRAKGEDFNEGFQSMPANWQISSPRKKAFFDLLKKMSKSKK